MIVKTVDDCDDPSEKCTFGQRSDGVMEQLEEENFEYSIEITSGLRMSLRLLNALECVTENYMTYELGVSLNDRQKIWDEVLGGIKLFIKRNIFQTIDVSIGYTP